METLTSIIAQVKRPDETTTQYLARTKETPETLTHQAHDLLNLENGPTITKPITSISATGFKMNWEPSQLSDLDSYSILIVDVAKGSTIKSEGVSKDKTSYTATELTAGTEYAATLIIVTKSHVKSQDMQIVTTK